MTPADRSRRDGWPVIVAYAFVCAATQLLWLTFAAITTESARHFAVSETAVGWLAEIFPLLYVVLAIPSGALLDRFFRPSLALGGALVAVGGLVRLAGSDFAWAMTGQVLVALAQPVVLSAAGKLAGEYGPEHLRPSGISVGSAGNFVGMVLALILGPTVGGHGHIERLLELEAVLGVLPAVGLALALRTPGGRSSERAAIAGNAARALWRLEPIRIFCGLVFLGFGIFVALATWLQTLLEPYHVSETTAGLLLVAMIVAGVIGCAVLVAPIARRGGERTFMAAVVAAASLSCLALALLTALGLRAAALVVLGLLLLPSLPVVLSRAERLSGPLAGTAGAIIWMAGNLGGLVVALLVQVLDHHPSAAFLALAGVALLGTPLVVRLGAVLPKAAAPLAGERGEEPASVTVG